ncbi:MAG TPA: hypothetical protein VE395_03390, partial [Acidimicrobiales bacterium]|nr:hypothetical protein [Acidimicrobiales bacterium]
MSVDDRARRASREVQDHYAGSDQRPPVVGGPPRRGRSVAVVLVAVLAAVAGGAVLLRDGGGGDPVRAGPGQGTVRTTTSTTTSTTAVPGDAAPSEPHQPDGVTAPRSVRGDRTVFRVTDVSGGTYLVDLPASTPGADRATVVASVYVGPARPAPVGDEPGMYLGAALFEQPAAVIAPDEPAPGWTPVPGPQRTLEGGARFTQWEQVGPSSPQRFPLELSTIEREGWTLALDGPGQDGASRVA